VVARTVCLDHVHRAVVRLMSRFWPFGASVLPARPVSRRVFKLKRARALMNLGRKEARRESRGTERWRAPLRTDRGAFREDESSVTAVDRCEFVVINSAN
jgi:hypothetical protein